MICYLSGFSYVFQRGNHLIICTLMSSVTIVSSLDFNSAVFTQFFLLIEGFFLSNIWGFFLLFGAFCVIGLFFRFIYKV